MGYLIKIYVAVRQLEKDGVEKDVKLVQNLVPKLSKSFVLPGLVQSTERILTNVLNFLDYVKMGVAKIL